MDLLLDYGANVNKLTNEGLSALSACHILLYTQCMFLDNMAESMPRENLFNTVELDKRSGTVINRNDRKTIMALYETIHQPLFCAKSTNGNSRKKSAPAVSNRALSAMAAPPRRTSLALKMVSLAVKMEDESEEEEENVSVYDQWKMEFYQQSIDHVKQIEQINR